MNNKLFALATIGILVMIHWAIVDYRFRIAGGLASFWLQSPAPPALWLVRLTAIPPLIATLFLYHFGPVAPMWIAIGLLLLVHVTALVLLKVHPVE
jgi:hypothetical protein